MRRYGRPSRGGLALFGGIVVWATMIAGACTDDGVAAACTDVPDGGCPLAHGIACADPSCEAVYLCRPNNVWVFDHLCPPREAGPESDAGDGGDADAGIADSGPAIFDANVDAPPGAFGGVGCDDLESPECSVGLALACGPGCCGCEDLFVCNNGGWDLWGACLDGGVVHGPD